MPRIDVQFFIERLDSLPPGDKEWDSEAIQYLLDGNKQNTEYLLNGDKPVDDASIKYLLNGDKDIQDEEANEIRILTEGTGIFFYLISYLLLFYKLILDNSDRNHCSKWNRICQLVIDIQTYNEPLNLP